MFFVIIAQIIGLTHAQYVHYKAHEYNPSNVDLFFYEYTTMNSFTKTAYNSRNFNSGNSESEIIDTCRLECSRDQPRCRNVVIDQHGNTCQFYDVDGKVLPNSDSRYQLISIHMFEHKPYIGGATGYCKELDYMNLCGNCTCHDMTPPSKTPYYCDCTQAIATKLHCQDILKTDPKAISGLYYIDPDKAGQFTVYCNFNEGFAKTRFIRRVDKDTNYLSNVDSTYYYIHNNDNLMRDSMLGLKYAQRLTNAFTFYLLVDYVRYDGMRGRSAYSYFKLEDGDKYRAKWISRYCMRMFLSTCH